MKIPILKLRMPKLSGWFGVGAVGFIVGAGIVGWYWYNLLPVNSQNDQAVVFRIEKGESAVAVVANLEKQGLIRHQSAFLTYITLQGLRSRLQAGEYSISPARSASQIAGILTKGIIKSNQLVVPEGSTIKKITELAKAKGIAEADFRTALNQSYSYSFLATKPAGVDLEGYLFPDTYTVTSKTTAAEIVKAMLDNFGRRVGSKQTAGFAAQGLNLHQGLTLASIVEREVSIEADRAVVAQVLLKRLRIGMPLETDPTVHYAADLLGVGFNLAIDSPYNTYKYAGLPPGPICSPGLSAMNAVMNPANTEYLYFLSGKDGKTYFAKTFPEHQKNINLYLR